MTSRDEKVNDEFEEMSEWIGLKFCDGGYDHGAVADELGKRFVPIVKGAGVHPVAIETLDEITLKWRKKDAVFKRLSTSLAGWRWLNIELRKYPEEPMWEASCTLLDDEDRQADTAQGALDDLMTALVELDLELNYVITGLERK